MKVRNGRLRFLGSVLVFIITVAFPWIFRNTAYSAPIINDDPIKTIKQRCKEQVGPQLESVCCQPPDYWQNPSCPYGARQDILNSDNSTSDLPSRQFGTAEEGWLYQTLLSCLEGGGNKSSCGAAAAKQFAENFMNRSPGCAAAFSGEESPEKEQYRQLCRNTLNNVMSTLRPAAEYAIKDWQAEQRKSESLPQSFTDKLFGGSSGRQNDPELHQRFESLDQQAVPLMRTQITDSANKAIEENTLEKGLGKSLPSATVEYSLASVEKGQVVSAGMPDGLPVTNVVLSSSQNVENGSLSVEVSDGATPLLLRGQEVPPPDPNSYKSINYLNVKSLENQKEAHPWTEAWFEFFLPLMPGNNFQEAALQRWDQDQKKWDKLPTSPIGCNKTSCRYVAKSPGTSYFAITVKKELFIWRYILTSTAFWGCIVYFVYSWIKSKRKKKSQSTKKQICRFCRSEIDNEATRCPHCAGDLRIWPIRHPILTVLLVTILASATGIILDNIKEVGFFLGGAIAAIIFFGLFKLFKRHKVSKAVR